MGEIAGRRRADTPINRNQSGVCQADVRARIIAYPFALISGGDIPCVIEMKWTKQNANQCRQEKTSCIHTITNGRKRGKDIIKTHKLFQKKIEPKRWKRSKLCAIVLRNTYVLIPQILGKEKTIIGPIMYTVGGKGELPPVQCPLMCRRQPHLRESRPIPPSRDETRMRTGEHRTWR